MRAVALITTLLLLGTGLLRPPSNDSGVPRDIFWLEKSQWGPEYDIVLAGDSRTYCSTSPAVMSQSLGDYRIANFGFPAAGLIEVYLEAVERLLDPASPHRTVILGVTPHSLTPEATMENDFLEIRNMHAVERQIHLRMGRFLHFLRPFNLMELTNAVTGRKLGIYQTFYPDGWVAQRRVPDNPMNDLNRYSEMFINNEVDERSIDEALEFVRSWSSSGTRVYGFRPPTTPEMVELENEKSGFNHALFVTRFEEAGGTWLDLPLYGYHSHDGSHLREDAARVFSSDLAQALASNGAHLMASTKRP
jgi:hypothetical protein